MPAPFPRYSSPRGFIALLSTLILCAVLSVLAFEAGGTTYFARLEALNAERHEQSKARAYSCAQVALLKLAADPTYRPSTGGDVISLDAETTCTISSIVHSSATFSITTYANTDGATSILLTIAHYQNGVSSPLSIDSIRAITSSTP